MIAVIYKKYGTPDVLKLVDIPKPTPNDTEVLVKIIATSVTPVDTAFRSGNPKIARLFTGLFKPKNPILGTELSGVVEAVGKGVNRFSPGDRVFAAAPGGLGAHAQYICMAQDAALVKMPDIMSFEEAAVIDNGALTALPFLRDGAKLRRGQKILIIGASGSVGTAAVQLAAAMGAEVTGVCSTSNLEMVRDLGATQVIDYTQSDFSTSGQTYDVIFDTVGKSTFGRCRASLAKGGIFITTVPDPTTLLSPLFRFFLRGKRAKILATGLRKDAAKIKDMKALMALVVRGDLIIVIDRSYPLEQIATAHSYVEQGHKRGNLVINVSHRKSKI